MSTEFQRSPNSENHIDVDVAVDAAVHVCGAGGGRGDGGGSYAGQLHRPHASIFLHSQDLERRRKIIVAHDANVKKDAP